MYIADTANHRIRMVLNGVISTIAGTGTQGYSGDDGAATSATLSRPTAVTLDSSGTKLKSSTLIYIFLNYCYCYYGR